jgi:hypothetical protein
MNVTTYLQEILLLLVVVAPAGPTTANSTATTSFLRVNQTLLLQLIGS